MRLLQAARGTTIAGSPRLLSPRVARGASAAIGVALLVLDFVTKQLAVTRLDPEHPVRLAGGLLHLQLVRNPGAAFSLGENATPVFTALAVVALVIISWWLLPRVRLPWWVVATGLLLAGVAGNLVDRLVRAPGVFHGHVVDFLQLPHWPIFNVADMCLTSAAVLIVILSTFGRFGPDGALVAGRGARVGHDGVVEPVEVPPEDER